jgi:hypothetical protein
MRPQKLSSDLASGLLDHDDDDDGDDDYNDGNDHITISYLILQHRGPTQPVIQ